MSFFKRSILHFSWQLLKVDYKGAVLIGKGFFFFWHRRRSEKVSNAVSLR
jgi:hypothetical protein